MNCLFEALFVGFYNILLYLIFSQVISNSYFLLFVIGFMKHYLGYWLSLHTYYCNYGNACKNVNKKYTFYSASNNIIFNSLQESILFLLLGTLLTTFIQSKIVLYFFIGFILHMCFELLHLHEQFCIEKCNSVNNKHNSYKYNIIQ